MKRRIGFNGSRIGRERPVRFALPGAVGADTIHAPLTARRVD